MNDPEVCHFQPGQLVECIDDEWVDEHGERREGGMPVSGCIYTVTDLKDYLGVVFMRLDTFAPDIWFSSLHFRPVQTPSIDCFRQLLAPFAGARTGMSTTHHSLSGGRIPAVSESIVTKGRIGAPAAARRFTARQFGRLSHPFPTAQHEGWQALRSLAGHAVHPRANLARRLSIRCGGALLSHRSKSSGVSMPLSSVESKETGTCRRSSPQSRSFAPQTGSMS